MLKRVGDRRHSCLTRTVILNHSPMLPFIWTALVAFSYSCSVVRTRCALILYFRTVARKAACHTLSKAFFEIMEDMVRILLMVEVLFTQYLKVDLFCCVPVGSEPSLFFSNYLFGLGFKPVNLGLPASLNKFCWYNINSSTYTTLVKTMYTACICSCEVKIHDIKYDMKEKKATQLKFPVYVYGVAI